MPTRIPSVIPTKVPTTSKPTRVPSFIPTKFPTRTPTKFPTSSRPTLFPTSTRPTFYPTSSHPTFYPSSSHPTYFPSISHPTRGPSTSHPTFYPSSSNPTRAPSVSPSLNPSLNATLHMHDHDADMLMGLPMEYVQYAFCGMVAFPCILIICFCCRNSGGKKSEKSLLEDIKMENGYDFNSIAAVDPSWHSVAEVDRSPPRHRVNSFRANSPVLEPAAKRYDPPDNFDRHNTSPYTSRSDRSDRHTSPYMNRSAQDRHTSPYMNRSTREGTITTQFGDFFEGYEYTDDDSESTSLVMYGAHLYGHKRDISTASSIISNPRQTHITSNPEFYVPVGRRPPTLSSVMNRAENRTVPPPPPPPEIPPFNRSFTPVEPPEETATCLPLYSPNDQESMLIEESIKFSPSLGGGILEPGSPRDPAKEAKEEVSPRQILRKKSSPFATSFCNEYSKVTDRITQLPILNAVLNLCVLKALLRNPRFPSAGLTFQPYIDWLAKKDTLTISQFLTVLQREVHITTSEHVNFGSMSVLLSRKDLTCVICTKNGKRSFLISREQDLAFSVQKSDPNVAEIPPTADLKARSFFMALMDFYGCSFPLVVYTVF